MPRTYNTVKAKKLPGKIPMKDCLCIALCANTISDCKVKPLLVYHSGNSLAFKSHKILKEKLKLCGALMLGHGLHVCFLWMGKSRLCYCSEDISSRK